MDRHDFYTTRSTALWNEPLFTFASYPNLAQSSATVLGDIFAHTICHIMLVLRAVIVF